MIIGGWRRGADALSKLPAWSAATCSCQDSLLVGWVLPGSQAGAVVPSCPLARVTCPFLCWGVRPAHSQLCDLERLQLKPCWGLQGQPVSPVSVRSSQSRAAAGGGWCGAGKPVPGCWVGCAGDLAAVQHQHSHLCVCCWGGDSRNHKTPKIRARRGEERL